MLNIKRFIGLTLTAFFIVAAVMAQDAGGRTSGGGTRQQNRFDVNLLRDSANRPDGFDTRNKMLKDISEAVIKGDISDEIYTALEFMSKERGGNTSKTPDNYFTIRQQVAAQLGKIGSARALDILIQLCRNETNQDVLRETFRALGDIGSNEDGKTVDIIIIKLQRFNGLPPDGDVARVLLAAVDAFDKIDKKNNGLTNQSKEVQEFLGSVSRNDRFPKSVRVQERAKQVLEDIIKRDTQRRQES